MVLEILGPVLGAAAVGAVGEAARRIIPVAGNLLGYGLSKMEGPKLSSFLATMWGERNQLADRMALKQGAPEAQPPRAHAAPSA